jgi:hypothetical protein
MEVSSAFAIFPIFLIIIYLALFGFGIYCMVLFIKLALRGIKALDIYIDEKSNRF